MAEIRDARTDEEIVGEIHTLAEELAGQMYIAASRGIITDLRVERQMIDESPIPYGYRIFPTCTKIVKPKSREGEK